MKRYFKKAYEESKKYFALDIKGLMGFAMLVVTNIAIYQILGIKMAKEYFLEFIVSTVITGGLFLAITFFVNLIRAPYLIVKEQDTIIENLKKIKSRENIYSQLLRLRKQGVVLRNQGNNLIHESSIEPWWQEHLVWRKTTANVLGLLDKNVADRWKVLDTFTPKRSFPGAITPDHRHKLQMFDAWLERLDKIIENEKETAG